MGGGDVGLRAQRGYRRWQRRLGRPSKQRTAQISQLTVMRARGGSAARAGGAAQCFEGPRLVFRDCAADGGVHRALQDPGHDIQHAALALASVLLHDHVVQHKVQVQHRGVKRDHSTRQDDVSAAMRAE